MISGKKVAVTSDQDHKAKSAEVIAENVKGEVISK